MASPDWVHPLPLVRDWFDKAKAGEELIYAHGRQLIRGETSLFVRDLAIAELVDPFAPRSPEGGFNFMIRKRAVPEAARDAKASADDEAMDAIFRALCRDANLGRRARSNAELARLAGLDTPAQAAWRITKLGQAGKIRTQTVTTGPHAGWRIVTIVGSGRTADKQTAAPPDWERAKAQVRQEQVR